MDAGFRDGIPRFGGGVPRRAPRPADVSRLATVASAVHWAAGMQTGQAATDDSAVAAALCHEIHQPLTCLLSSLERANQALRRQPVTVADQALLQVARLLADAHATAQHLARVVAEVHAQAQSEPRRMRQLDLRAAVRAAAAMAQPGNSDASEIAVDAPEAAWVDGVDTRLVHVFVALFAEALGEDAAVVARIRRVDGAIVTELRSGSTVVEPPARVVSIGAGAGTSRALSRAVARHIVSAHGGQLDHWPSAGAGILARVVLPSTSADRHCVSSA
jgi:nitrogen fixation/metabolism regulation signal transduction histidine kinase